MLYRSVPTSVLYRTEQTTTEYYKTIAYITIPSIPYSTGQTSTVNYSTVQYSTTQSFLDEPVFLTRVALITHLATCCSKNKVGYYILSHGIAVSSMTPYNS